MTSQQDVEAAVRAELGRLACDAVQALRRVGVPVPVMPGTAAAANEVEALRAQVARLTEQRTALIRLCQQILDRCGGQLGGPFLLLAVAEGWRRQLAEASADDPPPD
ncbi:hypothetical protein [Solwaraspora sp. WMMD792]|uniref:hypothetical protein n=1 Tax=Solwaraspora sp. WMMD792 TaxID=3016099 RepID=UPI002417D669|nr:hypothetical protein [Solwaraspora sp. WMMD792]MDG4768759.1 hypothetical protein [Solwaraspora sp. WMMD792]MDG4768798.1 hypothetical protein [Solwaraspora sp. WMMD792]MDG4768838.1 hypothetical protein [Solwaraspora sp. WMMD792]MDG4768846.1 hypothetical protein [Solwaraspora sp. WMMD792]MDG4768879.1 hypothetical protein [Solwaraspora sp. WMMD792]